MKSIVTVGLMLTAFLLPKQDAPVVIEFPRCNLTLKDAVDIVATWNIKHEADVISRPDTDEKYWGLTEPADNLITLSDKPAMPIRKMVVLHEFAHACYRGIGLSIPKEFEEQFVQQQADEMYKELYGGR